MSFKNFYNEIDLMYPEIAINAEKIDRLNPGTCKFYIPILMPYLSKSSISKKKEHFNNSDMLNVRPNLFDVGTLEITNFIEIKLSKEVCCGGKCQCLNYSCDECIKKCDYKIDRYIPENSKWVVVFIGGDINYPVIISKIPE
jgi:hypothetical protein